MKRSVWFAAAVAVMSSWASAASGEIAAASPDVPPEAASTWSWTLGASGETIFEHTRANLRDPHFGVRFYRDDQIPGTLHDVTDPTAPGADARAATPNGKHAFADVAFGEHMPIFTFFNVNPARPRYARGLQLNLDAAAFLLLDFDSQSSGVIDTDFRLGGSIDMRPWVDGWDHLSLSAGFFHESSHLGDEYALSAATIQAGAVPVANPALPYRANPSYMALPAVVSLDLPFGDRLSGRLYGGATLYLSSELPNTRFPSEWRAGGELRWTTLARELAPIGTRDAESPSAAKRALAHLIRRSSGRHHGEPPETATQRNRRGPFSVELAYELWAKRRYDHVGDMRTATFVAADGYFHIQHAMLVGFYNLDTLHSSSNALGLSLDWLRGRSPFGQLIQYAQVDTFAVGLSYYW